MPYWSSQDTTKMDRPAIAYEPIPEIAAPTVGGLVEIPLRLQTYSAPDVKPTLTQVTSLPLYNEGTSFQYGSGTLSTAASQLPRIQLEGYIDTPLTNVGGVNLPTLSYTQISTTVRITFVQFMIMCFEGTAPASVFGWAKWDPIWFRDPYGRIYSNPKVLDLNGAYVEAIPGRNTFSISLKV